MPNGEFIKKGFEIITRVITRGKKAYALSLRDSDVKRIGLKNKQILKVFIHPRSDDVGRK